MQDGWDAEREVDFGVGVDDGGGDLDGRVHGEGEHGLGRLGRLAVVRDHGVLALVLGGHAHDLKLIEFSG